MKKLQFTVINTEQSIKTPEREKILIMLKREGYDYYDCHGITDLELLRLLCFVTKRPSPVKI